MSVKLRRAFDVARGRCVPDISTNPPVPGLDCRDAALVRIRNYWQKAMVVLMEVVAGSFSWLGFFWLFRGRGVERRARPPRRSFHEANRREGIALQAVESR